MYGRKVRKRKYNGSRKKVLGVMDVFVILIMVSWVHRYAKAYQIVHFKYEQFTVCQLYLNKAFFKKTQCSTKCTKS